MTACEKYASVLINGVKFGQLTLVTLQCNNIVLSAMAVMHLKQGDQAAHTLYTSQITSCGVRRCMVTCT